MANNDGITTPPTPKAKSSKFDNEASLYDLDQPWWKSGLLWTVIIGALVLAGLYWVLLHSYGQRFADGVTFAIAAFVVVLAVAFIRDWRFAFGAIAILIALLLSLSYFNVWDPYGLHPLLSGNGKVLTASSPNPLAAPNKTPPTKPVAPKVAPVESDAGKLCLEKQAEELAKQKGARLKKMHDEIEVLRVSKKISDADAKALEAEVIAHPDGSPGETIGKDGLVKWTVMLPSGATHLEYQLVCTCTERASITLPPPPPVPPKPRMATMVNPCVRVEAFIPEGDVRITRAATVRNAPIASMNCWGYIDNAKRIGSPNNCDTCEWINGAVEAMRNRFPGVFRVFHALMEDASVDRDRFGKNKVTKITYVFPVAAKNGGVALCIEIDGVMYDAYLILPTSWQGNTYTIPRSFFLNQKKAMEARQ